MGAAATGNVMIIFVIMRLQLRQRHIKWASHTPETLHRTEQDIVQTRRRPELRLPKPKRIKLPRFFRSLLDHPHLRLSTPGNTSHV
jgi:hypothetical protein